MSEGFVIYLNAWSVHVKYLIKNTLPEEHPILPRLQIIL